MKYCIQEVHSAREATDALVLHKEQSFEDPVAIAETVQLLEAVLYHACEDRLVGVVQVFTMAGDVMQPTVVSFDTK